MMTTVDWNVEGMSCGHCKMSIEEALLEVGGVEEAQVDLDGGTVAITYEESKVEVSKLKEAISEAGPYEVV